MDTDTVIEDEDVPASPDTGSDGWSAAGMLPTNVMVAVPIPKFRVRDVLALKPGCIVSSDWQGGRDIPLLAGEVQFAWIEFEVMDEKLSARITRFS
jgi:Type III flagellar switch regulator (C-ring) FliN C-term